VAIQDNECGTTFRLAEAFQCIFNAIEVVRIAYFQNVPSIGMESRRHVFSECESGVSLNRDVVVVENPAKIVETQMTRQ
jgi:hypothetical protein